MRLHTVLFLAIALFLVVSAAILWISKPKADAIAADDQWQLTNVSNHLPDLEFDLTSDTGKPVTQADYRGDVTLLFFGFTNCPDECPATMSRLTGVLKQLGKDADPIRVLFVTVDPAFDTPHILHDYLKNFDAVHMVGLTGTNDQIRNLAGRYRAAYQPRDAAGGADSIAHGNAIYIFDSQGHARLLATPSDSDEKLIHDLRYLATSSVAP